MPIANSEGPDLNPSPAEPRYTLPLQTVYIQISWKKPTDLVLHCLSFSMWIYSNKLDQVIWLAGNWKWVWHLNLGSIRLEGYPDSFLVSPWKVMLWVLIRSASMRRFFLQENICCTYSLEAPQWDASNEYPQHIFSWRNKIISYTFQLIITKSCLYNFDPLKPYFYLVKLGFTGIYIIVFLIFARKHRLWYSLELPCQGGSIEYPQSMF